MKRFCIHLLSMSIGAMALVVISIAPVNAAGCVTKARDPACGQHAAGALDPDGVVVQVAVDVRPADRENGLRRGCAQKRCASAEMKDRARPGRVTG